MLFALTASERQQLLLVVDVPWKEKV